MERRCITMRVFRDLADEQIYNDVSNKKLLWYSIQVLSAYTVNEIFGYPVYNCFDNENTLNHDDYMTIEDKYAMKKYFHNKDDINPDFESKDTLYSLCKVMVVPMKKLTRKRFKMEIEE